jgi:hypothetical protein
MTTILYTIAITFLLTFQPQQLRDGGEVIITIEEVFFTVSVDPAEDVTVENPTEHSYRVRSEGSCGEDKITLVDPGANVCIYAHPEDDWRQISYEQILE